MDMEKPSIGHSTLLATLACYYSSVSNGHGEAIHRPLNLIGYISMLLRIGQ